MTALRRYAPFALLVATQMVLVLVAPSHGTGGANGPLGGQFPGGSAASQGGLPGGPGATTGAPGATGLPAGSTGGAGGAAGGAAGTGAAGSGGSTSGAGIAPASGQTAKGTFCITGLNEHPPCVARWAGGSNGGATWQGVTATSVTVVMYRPKANAAVDAILRETGTYTPPAAEKQQLQVVNSWINKHLQLYNRKLNFVYYQGACDIAPPSDSCFRGDADTIASKFHPFAVFWPNDTNEAAFHDELSRKGVVNWGGWAFTDTFSQNLRPYHYDLFMGGDVQAEITGEWYCRRLANQKARYAGAAYKNTLRKVAVVYPDTPQTTPAAQHLIRIIKSCDRNGALDAKYSSDTSTAASQATTNTAQHKADGVTTLIWFSDPIAPAYGTKAATSQRYFPENVIAGSGLLDYDALAQTYDSQQWQHAFGPSDLGNTAPVIQTDAGRIWRAEGHSGSPNANSNLLTTYALTLAGGVTAAGPKLTPLTYEYGVLTMPGYDQWSRWHNPQLVYVKFGRGDYTGISDIREVYWNAGKTSPTNNRAGSYIPLNGGRRYQPGGIPSGDPGLPGSV